MNYNAERRLEEKQRRRGEILDAATEVASRNGIDTTTMDQVARKARLSRALLYVYFKDKTDLHFGLCERAMEQLYTRFAEAAGRHRNGLERLEAMGRAYVAFSQEFPVYFEVLARFEARDPDALRSDGNLLACVAAGDRVHQVLTDAIEAGMADGSIRADVGDSNTVAVALWGFLHGVIQLVATKSALIANRGTDPRKLMEQALSLASIAVVGKRPDA
ncbi:MAG: TetR/AcrR family transcriptional regulator [Steroidobacteraceae bacterium]